MSDKKKNTIIVFLALIKCFLNKSLPYLFERHWVLLSSEVINLIIEDKDADVVSNEFHKNFVDDAINFEAEVSEKIKDQVPW